MESMVEKERQDPAPSAGVTMEDGAAVSKVRELEGYTRWVVTGVAVALTLFQLYTAFFGTYVANTQRAAHITFVLVLVFLLYKPLMSRDQSRVPVYDWALLGLTAGVYGYFVLQGQEISGRFSFTVPLTNLELLAGTLALVLLLEATRRVVGNALCIIAATMLAYTLVGGSLPGALGHQQYALDQVVEQLFFTTSGVFGVPLGVSASFIFLFILFGKFLEGTGGGKFFMDLALSTMGRYRGGPAKAAIAGSSLMGTISGSAVANVATSGTFTIPMMRRTGYGRTFSGAVESVASSGGQIMPPIMGAAAFIIASFLGVPYGQVALAALIPAIVYFACLFFQVDFRAVRLGLRGLGEEVPSFTGTIKTGFLYLIPLAVIIYMLIEGFSIMRVGLFAIATTAVVGAIISLRNLAPRNLLRISEAAARGVIEVAVACAVAGLVVGLISQTGLGLRFNSLLLTVAGGSLFITLLLTMVASIILGMGLPTSAAYIVQIPLTIPALIELGVVPIAAHLFVFYFACMSAITPPVALAAFAGAAISGANPMRTGFTAVRLGIVAFIIPFVFAYSPEILIVDSELQQILLTAATVLFGAFALAAAAEGWLLIGATWYERVLLAVGALTLISPGLWTDIPGLAAMALALLSQILRGGRLPWQSKSAGESSSGA